MLSFFGGNFAQNSANFAKAESENPAENSTENSTENSANIYAQNSEIQNQNSENSQNYEIKKLDFIQFDGKSYVNLKFKPTEKTEISTKFSFSENDAGNYSTIFGAQDSAGNMLQFYKDTKEHIQTTYKFGAYANFPTDLSVEIDKIYDLSYANKTYNFDGFSVASPRTTSVDAPLFIGTKSMGTSYESGAPMFDGKIYAFSLRDDGNLVLNLIPAAKYSGCGENFVVEYGFANDLDNDGNLANDEFFGNSGTGKLTGSEEISPEKCAEIPEENSDENAENFAKNPDEVLVPNTGI